MIDLSGIEDFGAQPAEDDAIFLRDAGFEGNTIEEQLMLEGRTFPDY